MRDIRSDLEDRAKLCEEQIGAAYQQFEIVVQQLHREHDAKVADLKSTLAMIKKLIEFENSHIDNVVTLTQATTAEQRSSLSDRIRAASSQ